LKKDLIGQVVKLIVENEKLKEEVKWWGEEDKDKLDTIQELEKHTWDLESDLEELKEEWDKLKEIEKLKEEKGKLKREVMEVQGKLNVCLMSCEEYRGEIRDLQTKLEDKDKDINTELVMMYSIIMNDGVKSEIPFLNGADTIDKLKTNITLMLEKFKMMGEYIGELKEENQRLKGEDK